MMGELIAGVSEAVMEATLRVLVWIPAPIKFLFSRSYRQTVITEWREHPWLGLLQILGGAVMLTMLVGVVWFWYVAVALMIDEKRHPAKARVREAAWRVLEERVREAIGKTAAADTESKQGGALPP
jgi:uncharacterized oligopeptide transporter (OPT) family protein